MSRFLALCLLIIPFAQGFTVSSDTAPSTAVLKTIREMEEEIYQNITSNKPQSAFLPPVTPDEDGHIGPVHIKVNTYIRDIQMKRIATDLYEWTADLTFRQFWNDKRLAYDVTDHPDIKYVVLNTPNGVRSIWKPDTFFSKSVKSSFHFVMEPNVLVWVYPNGDVTYSARASVTFNCHAVDDARTKIGDKLVCPMRVASYAWADDKVVYDWDEETPVQFRPENLYIPGFTLNKVTTESNTGKTKIGNFSSLKAKFHFLYK